MMRSKSYKEPPRYNTTTTTPTKFSSLLTTPIFMPLDEEDPAPPPPPPPPHTEVSIPFMWEEAPGKPRSCHIQSEPNNKSSSVRTLELPPRLSFVVEGKVSSNHMEAPSPTTVLGGPYVGRAKSFSSSYRTPREYWNFNFGSTRWSSGLRKIRKEGSEGSFDFSSSSSSCPITLGTPNKGKVTRATRRGSLPFFEVKTRSHFWAGIYESFKHMVPWRRGQEEKQRKLASKFDTV